MIRYTCEACGKALRANEDIIGRKAQCTGCGTIARVPEFSTRPSLKKNRPTRNSGRLRDATDKKLLPGLPTHAGSERGGPPEQAGGLSADETGFLPEVSEFDGTLKTLPEADVAEEFEPVFKRLEPKKNAGSPRRVFIAGSLLAFLAVGYWAVGYGKTNGGDSDNAFALTPAAIQYRTALLELKKSQRVLRVMADGYLTAKTLPESELGDLNEFLSSIDLLTNENFALDEATELFVAGDRTAAKNLIQKEIANLNRLQEKVTERTKAFQSKTYQ